MKRIALIILFSTYLIAFSCTTFVLKTDSTLLFGRNLDWVSDNGLIIVNHRNVKKESLVFPPDKPVNWTSKYGSITFNQFGKEFPFGGINEMGLVVEIMASEADYPDYDNRGAVNELQWIQYQLDNAANIDDVLNNDSIIRLSKVSEELHYLICDKDGNVAVVEFIEGKMVVYRNEKLPVPVLANDPYINSLYDLNILRECRFTKATQMINNYKPDFHGNAVSYSFQILDSVVLDGSWSIVYDINNMQIHFKTASFSEIRTFYLDSFDFSCKPENLGFDLKANISGDITDSFKIVSPELNDEKLSDAIEQNPIYLPENYLKKIYKYHQTTECAYIE